MTSADPFRTISRRTGKALSHISFAPPSPPGASSSSSTADALAPPPLFAPSILPQRRLRPKLSRLSSSASGLATPTLTPVDAKPTPSTPPPSPPTALAHTLRTYSPSASPSRRAADSPALKRQGSVRSLFSTLSLGSARRLFGSPVATPWALAPEEEESTAGMGSRADDFPSPTLSARHTASTTSLHTPSLSLSSAPSSPTSSPPSSAPPSPNLKPGPLPPLEPTLARAEQASKIATHTVCAGCAREGVNAPMCRCGLTWCGRECRLGVRHSCATGSLRGRG